MKIIGLTGGIGSGKSTVARLLHAKGIAVYNSDKQAKELMLIDKSIRKGIERLFGEDAYINGELNRAKIAKAVFSKPEKRKAINELVHPVVRTNFLNWVEVQNSLYVVKEAAILFESGAYKQCDWVITISAPSEERVERCVLNRKMSREEIMQRIKSQWTDEQRDKLTDFKIENSGSLADLEKKTEQLHVKIVEKINQSR